MVFRRKASVKIERSVLFSRSINRAADVSSQHSALITGSYLLDDLYFLLLSDGALFATFTRRSSDFLERCRLILLRIKSAPVAAVHASVLRPEVKLS